MQPIKTLIRNRSAARLRRLRRQLQNQRNIIASLIRENESTTRIMAAKADELERYMELHESAKQSDRQKGAELEILHKQVSHLAEIIERDRLRVQSEMRIYTDLIEGDRDLVNPSRAVAERMRGME